MLPIKAQNENFENAQIEHFSVLPQRNITKLKKLQTIKNTFFCCTKQTYSFIRFQY